VEPAEREWIDRFLSHLAHERRMSAHTIMAYRRDLHGLAEFGAKRRFTTWPPPCMAPASPRAAFNGICRPREHFTNS
jgi:site-specific recombinase XerC